MEADVGDVRGVRCTVEMRRARDGEDTRESEGPEAEEARSKTSGRSNTGDGDGGRKRGKAGITGTERFAVQTCIISEDV